MRIETVVSTVGICALLCAMGCEEEDKEPVRVDAAILQDASTGGPGGGGDAAAAADAGADADDAEPVDGASDAGLLASSSGPWTVYMDPYGDAGGANPAMGIQGSATARATDGGMQITLNVSGLPSTRGFGSHLHKLACDDMSAGGHYQHMPAAAADASATDPAFANPTNEVWLDFTTDDAGTATSSASVDWTPPEGGAAAIVVHDRLTGDGGVAGPKLACLPFPL